MDVRVAPFAVNVFEENWDRASDPLLWKQQELEKLQFTGNVWECNSLESQSYFPATLEFEKGSATSAPTLIFTDPVGIRTLTLSNLPLK